MGDRVVSRLTDAQIEALRKSLERGFGTEFGAIAIGQLRDDLAAERSARAALVEELASERVAREKAEDGWKGCGLYWQDQLQRLAEGYRKVLIERDEARALLDQPGRDSEVAG